ncbi:MAG: ATP-dependent metallopeptidase FtsH/Yme1/Tma family protein [Alphaproteobacteria bacterium]|nr:ATP-dependent metallopeptidase FtsH/Yme1/Tma family protein [Alphaproteobacteria bacterium]
MVSLGKNIGLWLVIIALAAFLYNIFTKSQFEADGTQISYSEFVSRVENNQVRQVQIEGNNISGYTTINQSFKTYAPNDIELLPLLRQHNVQITAKPIEGPSLLSALLINLLPMLLLIGVWVFLWRQMQGGGANKAMGFGKSKAKLLNEKSDRVTFDDVAGIEEAKQELEEIVEFLRDPSRYQRLGGRIPKGVLLIGPPGTGKTLTARAVAGEANVPFFTISGSDFVEMFVGVGAARVRDMFEQGKKNAPCIIFIDEIDAVGRHRGAGLGGGNDEREQTLNQLLVEMDGFESNEGVILIAATNRPDVLDPALLRPGRFDRQVVVPNPDILGREKIINVHIKKIPITPDVNIRIIARGTPGFSGADLANIVNEAALIAARRNRRAVSMRELEEAKDKVMMGAERRSMVMSEDEKKLTAYHEAGHALAALHSPASDPIHKATIIPRGRALGMVMRLPERDEISMARDKLEANLVVGMGGRLAEEKIFGPEKITTGASSDIEMITSLSRRMVTEWGMSDKLGPLRYQENQDEVFLGHLVARTINMSDKTAKLIDDEIRALISRATKDCWKILNEHENELHIIAKGLLEYETLSGDNINALLNGENINKTDSPIKSKKSGSRASSVRSKKPPPAGETDTAVQS